MMQAFIFIAAGIFLLLFLNSLRSSAEHTLVKQFGLRTYQYDIENKSICDLTLVQQCELIHFLVNSSSSISDLKRIISFKSWRRLNQIIKHHITHSQTMTLAEYIAIERNKQCKTDG